MRTNQFRSAWWLPNSHLQTIWPVLCRRIVPIPLKRERFELPDGDFVDLDWVEARKTATNQTSPIPLIIVLHGFEGSIDSHYAKSILRKISNEGWRGVFVHFRGCSGEPNRLSRNYHSGDTSDISYIIKKLKEREPNVPFAAVGFSLGGNVLLKWLGETREQNPLKAAIAISVPFELYKSCMHVQQGFARFYQWYFIRSLRSRLIHKYQTVTVPFDTSIINKLTTLYEYDDKITAPLHGFSGVDEYYTVASARQYLNDIKIPTLIVHAKDDPFVPVEVIPEPYELSPQVTLELTEQGGHVGFVMGKFPWNPTYWLDQRIPDYFKNYL